LNWSIPALFFPIAIVLTFDVFMPRPDRQWTGFTVSGAFGVLAILAVISIIHSSDYKISRSLFPVLMAALCIACAVASMRERRKVRDAKSGLGP
jgi:hypothetical protein